MWLDDMSPEREKRNYVELILKVKKNCPFGYIHLKRK